MKISGIRTPNSVSYFFALAVLVGIGCTEAASSGGQPDLPIGDVSLVYHIAPPDIPTGQTRENVEPNFPKVALLDDVDGDRKQDLAMAFPLVDHEEISRAGRISVYSGMTGDLLYIVAGTTPGEQMGSSLYSLGDITGDGRGDFVVAGRYSVRAYSGSDATVVYSIEKNTMEGETLRVSSPVTLIRDTGSDELFLDIFFLDGDFDIASYNARTGQQVSRITRYSLPEHAWDPLDPLTKLFPPDPSDVRASLVLVPQGFDPTRVLPFPDLDHDGLDDLVIATPGSADDKYLGAGTVEVVNSRTGRPIYSLYGKAPQEHFGRSVLLLPDLDGDMIAEILVGGPGTKGDLSSGKPNLGSLQMFSGSDGTSLFSILGTTPNGRLGESVWTYPDLDGDDITEVLAYTPVPLPLAPNQVGRLILFSGRSGSVLWSSLLPSDSPDESLAFEAIVANLTIDSAMDLVLILESGIFVYRFHPGLP